MPENDVSVLLMVGFPALAALYKVQISTHRRPIRPGLTCYSLLSWWTLDRETMIKFLCWKSHLYYLITYTPGHCFCACCINIVGTIGVYRNIDGKENLSTYRLTAGGGLKLPLTCRVGYSHLLFPPLGQIQMVVMRLHFSIHVKAATPRFCVKPYGDLSSV